MTILGIGVDIAHIPRFSALTKRRGPTSLARRILSQVEFDQWTRLDPSKNAQFMAVRWALKEATYKAVYPSLRPSWKDLSYHPLGTLGPGAKPSLSYESQPGLTLHCSVSHDGDYIFATVLVEK
ncbi:4'-phosphopantetheinyl transferase [Gymnopus androsaceus JB14]|uniref:4'-phosphopantetheinyl transferase n=1 Tax=Gymnopus androsaceus JB14 TaxID=1447944 RepID=A0A6A4IKG8_9AGAR|nr:4'-phosphopantetheinyl transferase [Gymnopus androsaceus JB14]